MGIKKQLLKSGHRCRPGGNYDKLSITIHSTGNPSSTAQNERDWLDNPANDRDASWHYVVDEKEVIQAIPEIEEAWHCGSAVGNRFSIGIEICESGDREKTLQNAAAFVAEKLKEYGWDCTYLRKHADWANKNCPRILIDSAYIKDGMDWNWFVDLIEKKLEGEKEMTVEEAKEIIQKTCGFDDNTMQYLSFYRYSESLLIRLAQAMK